MRDPIRAAYGALARDPGGIAIIRYPDLGLRDWIVNEVSSLAPSEANPLLTTSVEEAIRTPDRMVLLVPTDETEAVLDLDGGRDRLLDTRRAFPIVLFLLRDGDGARALAEQAPSLWSWAGGSDTDPEALAEIDAAEEREQFVQVSGSSPEEWLARWRDHTISWTGETLATAYWAMLLEES